MAKNYSNVCYSYEVPVPVVSLREKCVAEDKVPAYSALKAQLHFQTLHFFSTKCFIIGDESEDFSFAKFYLLAIGYKTGYWV